MSDNSIAKHTPGPWKVGSWGGRCTKSHDGMRWHPGSRHPTDPCVYSPDFLAGVGGIAAENGAMVVQGTYDGLEMSEPDARLIAAAPDMLAVLQAFVKEQGEHQGLVSVETYAAACAAIAKAGGAA